MDNAYIQPMSIPIHFVNREPELQTIADKLAVGRRGKPIPLPIVCFWGAAGLGKSVLLQEIAKRWHNDLSTSFPRRSITALVNFERSPALWKENYLERSKVITQLLTQLAEQMKEETGDVTTGDSNKQAQGLVDRIVAWLPQATPVLIFDTLDTLAGLNADDFLWLQQRLVEPLVRVSFDQMLFVVASRGEWIRWQSFELRRRTDNYPLKPFDMETIAEQVDASQPAAQFLYEHSFGHPLTTANLAAQLKQMGIDLHATEFTPPHVKEFRYTLEHISRQVILEVPENLQKWALVMSILRWINVDVLRYLAEHLKWERKRGDAFYIDLIDKLQESHLLYSDGEIGAYRYDPSVRRLVARDLQIENAEVFHSAHEVAWMYHQQRLKRYPTYLTRYLPEVAYHGAILDRLEGTPAGMSRFRRWWDGFIPRCPAKPEDWKELLQSWEKDAELQEILSRDDYQLPLSFQVPQRPVVP